MTNGSSPADLQADHERANYAKVIGVALAAAVGGFLFGFDSSVVNGAVDAIQGHFTLSKFVVGATVAVALLGCALGAWFAGSLADRWGRKRVMLLGSFLFIISSAGAGLAFSVWDLAFWRVVGGVGIGIASVIAPAYISEIAPASVRGGLASLQQLAITVGIFVALLSDTVLQSIASGASQPLWLGLAAWRWMFLVGVIPAIIYGGLALMIPESPRYLVHEQRDEEASRVLTEVTGVRNPLEAINRIRKSFGEEYRSSFSDVKGNGFLGLHPLVWVGITLAALQQFVGINAIFYYSTTLWASVGFSQDDAFITSVITSIINVGMTFVAIFFVDRVGRRLLLLIGSVGMFVGLVLAAIAFANQVGSGSAVALPAPWGVVALVGANLFVIFFAATWGPILWVMLGEMFPNRMRAVALGIGTVFNWLANFAVTLLFPPLSNLLGLGVVYGIFALFAAISFFYVRAKVPETKGMELEDMGGPNEIATGKVAKANA